MGSSLESMMRLAIPSTLQVLGEDVVYYPLAVNPKTIKMLMNLSTWRKIRIGNTTQEGQVIFGEFSVRDDTEGHTTAKAYILDGQGDNVVWNGTTWYVMELLGQPAGGQQRVALCDKVLPLHRMG